MFAVDFGLAEVALGLVEDWWSGWLRVRRALVQGAFRITLGLAEGGWV